MVNPHAGSRNRVEYAENDPATGNVTANSPSAWIVQNSMHPTKRYAISSEAGPPVYSALPEATNSPVPG